VVPVAAIAIAAVMAATGAAPGVPDNQAIRIPVRQP
jgi:hypothetical protein